MPASNAGSQTDWLLSKPYTELLNQVSDVEAAGVQDVFHLTCQPQSLDVSPLSANVKVSLSGDDISSLLFQ